MASVHPERDEPIVIGGAREAMMKQGKWQGRSQSDLANAVKQVMMQKTASMSGTTTTLCISPDNGQRLPVKKVDAFQSIVGDCQSKDGFVAADRASARIKNEGALLGEENIFVESLLAAVSIGDEDIVREVVSGAQAPRLEEVWATGDNVYLSGVDISWDNFHIGDLLVFTDASGGIGAVVLNTGYPHFACWKYAVRAGDAPKAYINSAEGTSLRMRGIKGSFLLPIGNHFEGGYSFIAKNSSVRIVRQGTPEYQDIVKKCVPPVSGKELVFRSPDGGAVSHADLSNTQGYIDLLVAAGIESGKIDLKRYNRTLPDVTLQALGVQTSRAPVSMEISEAAKSGDGSVENVGIRMAGAFNCQDCRQRFDNQRALDLHWKFIHDPNRHQED